MSDLSLGAFRLDHTNDLSQQEVSELQSLLAAATDNDGVRPLSEHVWLHLVRGGDDHAEHLAQLVARGVAELSPYLPKEFVEGYGPIGEMGISAEVHDCEQDVLRELSDA